MCTILTDHCEQSWLKKKRKETTVHFGLHWLSCMFDIKKYHRAYDIGYGLILSLNTSNSPSAVLISVCFLLESKRNFSHFLFLSLKLLADLKNSPGKLWILNLHWKRQNEGKKIPFFFFFSHKDHGNWKHYLHNWVQILLYSQVHLCSLDWLSACRLSSGPHSHYYEQRLQRAECELLT